MTRRVLFPLFMLLFLQACSSPPPPVVPVAEPEPPTLVDLKIISAADLNTNTDGAGAPVVLRLYQLREASSFNNADFFTLFDNDQSALGPALAHKQEVLLKPNDEQTILLQIKDDVKSLGLFAAFRRLDDAQWRALLPLEAHKTTTATVRLTVNKVVVATEAVKQPAPDTTRKNTETK